MEHITRINYLLYDTTEPIYDTVATLVERVEADLADLELAYCVVSNRKTSLFNGLNMALKRLNYAQIHVTELSPFGCENQITEAEMCDLMNLTQKYFANSKISLNCNSMAVLLDSLT